MTLQELITTIQNSQDKLTTSQKLVGSYILQNYKRIPFISITAMAKEIGISDNTIVKFCNQIGMQKFSELKNTCADFTKAELVISDRLSAAEASVEKNSHPFDDELADCIAALHETLNDPNNRQAVPKYLAMLKNAENIYITGGRTSARLSDLFASFLRYLNLRVFTIPGGSGDYIDQMQMITPKDLVIILSFPRYTAQVIENLQDLKSRNIPMIAITDNGLSPLVSYVDLVFRCRINSTSYINTYVSCLALIEGLVRASSKEFKGKDLNRHIKTLESKLISQKIFL